MENNIIYEIASMIPPVNILNNGTQDPEDLRTVAQFKRLADIWRLDAKFREQFYLNPERAIAETGMDIAPEAFRLHTNPDEAVQLEKDVREGRCGTEVFPRSYLLYQSAVREIQQWYKEYRSHCTPEEPLFASWRARQDKRCLKQLGSLAKSMMHLPLAFELSDGCSVGCSFCALDAGRLKGVFQYTDYNADLWQKILLSLHHLIGDAAAYSICYYATEGLDNPDYEQFLADYYREFGILPQTTTAQATRNIARTRKLLHQGQAAGNHIDRFSVLSPGMRDTIFASFTPEELLRVLILPQYQEAPGCQLTTAGRSRDESEENPEGGTIACVSGFIVNMQRKTVRLVTPYVSDHAHPTGEWILEECPFTCSDDLEMQVRRMIRQYMPDTFELGKVCRMSCDFHLEERENSIRACTSKSAGTLLNMPMNQTALNILSCALKKQCYTGSELLKLLPQSTDLLTGFLLLNLLWHHGLIYNDGLPQ